MTLKEQLYKQCLEFIDNRFNTVNNTIKDIQKALLTETKSSAGDKHETGRAMLQLEREKAGQQLAEIHKVKEQLSKINLEKVSKRIGLGSVVYTTNANYFIAISTGALKIHNEVFYAISPITPIGLLLMGKTVGEEVTFRDNMFKILEVQ